MTIKAHCMGMEFPKRDTDGPKVTWAKPGHLNHRDWQIQHSDHIGGGHYRRTIELPTAADLDAVAEEQRVKEKTSAQVPNR